MRPLHVNAWRVLVLSSCTARWWRLGAAFPLHGRHNHNYNRPSLHRSPTTVRCITRSLSAALGRASLSSLVLHASLRDILEGKSSATAAASSSVAASPASPTPETSAGTTAAATANDECDVAEGGRGGTMKGPIEAQSASVVDGSPSVTTTMQAADAPTAPKAPDKATATPIISISDSYDSGNGELVSLRLVDGEDDYCDVHVTVRIKPDPYTQLEGKAHYQHFSFRSTLNPRSPAMRGLFSGRGSIKVKYIVENAGGASYSPAFGGYKTFVTTGGATSPFDPDSWTRVDDTSYTNGRLVWTHVHELDSAATDDGNGGSLGGGNSAYFAYFPPYSWERHLDLVSKCARARGATVTSLGQTLEGREIDHVTVGTGGKVVWIIHRQHPGESMAEFYAEGLLGRLLGLDGRWDNVATRARELFTFHIVPNANPDGSVNGYLRTNAAGQNLNREWCPSPSPLATAGGGGDDDDGDEKDATTETYDAPTLERSPEVYHILRRMDETGCDAFLDVHGDEELPFGFLAGSQGTSVWSGRLEALHGAFLASYARANGDMQAKVSYEPDAPGEGKANICSNQIAERFDCLSATLEMPFKEAWADTMNAAGGGDDGRTAGWGPERARRLGASVLDALVYVSPYLRDEGEFWKELSDDDAYVHPSSKY